MTKLDTHPAAGQAALRAPPATGPHASQEDLSFHRTDLALASACTYVRACGPGCHA